MVKESTRALTEESILETIRTENWTAMGLTPGLMVGRIEANIKTICIME